MGSFIKEYRSLLLRIARNITTKELGEISFLCAEIIPETRREEIKEAPQLLRELEHQSYLGIDNLNFLTYLLANIDRHDLILKLRDFQIQRNNFLRCLQERDRTVTSHSATNFEEERTSEDYRLREHYEGSLTSQRTTPQYSTISRDGGEFTVRCILRLASVGAWCAGCAYILYRYKDNPDTLANVMTKFVLPSGIVLRTFTSGSVNIVLRATDLDGLKQLWNRFKTGQLRDDLEKILVTDGLKSLANDEIIDFSVNISENEYRNACLDLMVAHAEVKRHSKSSRVSRPLRRSRSVQDLMSHHNLSLIGRDQAQEPSRDQLSENLMLSMDNRLSLQINISEEPLAANATYLSDFLRSNDKVPDVCVLLEREMVLSHDWRSLASEFGYKMTDIYRMERKTSPSLALLEEIVFKSPDITTSKLIEKLISLKRNDVVALIEGHAMDDNSLSIRNLPFNVRKEISVQLDSATQAQFSDVARGVIKHIRPSQIEYLQKCPSPAMALLGELEIIAPSQPVSALQSACIKAKIETAVETIQKHILKSTKPKKMVLDRLRLPVRKIFSRSCDSQDSGFGSEEPLSP